MKYRVAHFGNPEGAPPGFYVIENGVGRGLWAGNTPEAERYAEKIKDRLNTYSLIQEQIEQKGEGK